MTRLIHHQIRLPQNCPTDAAFAILTGNESSIADAVVTAIGVDAGAICTDAFLLAFVRFAAFICFFIAFHTRWALALERANCVDALAAFAQRRYGLAFINICKVDLIS